MNTSTLLLMALLAPLIGAVLILLSARKPNLRESFTLLSAASLIVIVFSLLPQVISGARPELELFELFPGMNIGFRLEPLGMLFACIASLLWPVNSIYSIGYMRGNDEKHQTRFYICFAIAIASTMGIALSANLVTLFIFYEMLTLSTYPLVTHKGTEDAKQSGRVYLGILLTTSICLLLPAIIWTYSLAGTTMFTEGGIIPAGTDGLVMTALFLLFVYGIGKAALMPVHRWLPAAMVAPTPVSALLHAVAVVKAGVFSIVKVSTYVFSPAALSVMLDVNFVLYLAGFTIIAASIVALRSDNLKRRLAYSTISQLSYVVLATALLIPISILGAALHILAHAFGKITLFFAAGSIYTATHKKNVSELDGIGYRMPITMAAFAIGSLSMIGVPPTAGFLSKWFILQGAFSIENGFAITVIIISTLLNAGYFLPIVYAAFFKQPVNDDDRCFNEAPWPIVLSLSFTAVMTMVLFFYPDIAIKLLQPWVSSLS
ncbi:MAG: monovalent cation/H+ antiporter subunit D family protein [Gammaproteobacteria bacterium]